MEQLPKLDAPATETDRAVRTGTNDRPIIDGQGKVLTKSITIPVFSGRSVAQKTTPEANNITLPRPSKDEEQPENSVSGHPEGPPQKMPKVGVEPTPGVNRTGF